MKLILPRNHCAIENKLVVGPNKKIIFVKRGLHFSIQDLKKKLKTWKDI